MKAFEGELDGATSGSAKGAVECDSREVDRSDTARGSVDEVRSAAPGRWRGCLQPASSFSRAPLSEEAPEEGLVQPGHGAVMKPHVCRSR